MSWLVDLTLLRPLWLLALPALAVAAIALRRRVAGLGDWPRVIDPALLRAFGALGRIEAGGARAPHLAALVAAGIVTLALAGPATERRDTAAFRNMDGVIFVFDASTSVFEDGHWPAMQTMGRFGIAALGSRPAGMVVFAGDAYVATDLTADTRQLGQSLSLIDADTVPDPGSRPHLGLQQALEMMRGAELLAADIVLVSDGAGLGPAAISAAAEIAAQGGRLSLVVPRAAPALQSLAATGGGQVFGLSDIDAFAAYLGAPDRTRLERQDFPLLLRFDLGRYLLIAALVPVALLFRRRAVG
ncbi:vWA domain-containing protein [Roseovarius sp. CAU 1744]|uniref:vWA domain-containing protein n=1 Tax=Roseovarius sp. CAU 1744 TaxID=3140368 RepID=UPI00325B9BE5